MEETWAEKLVNAAIFFGAVALILFVGWNEPLSYRFKSTTELQQPGGNTAPSQWRSQFGGTALDRAPYRVEDGRIEYTTNHDPNQTGTSTETDRRRGLRR